VSLPIEEEWRPVLDYEGLYEVSDQGRVRNDAGLIMAQYSKPPGRGRKAPGYQRVTLKRRSIAVHRLVLEAFVRPRRPEVDEVCRHLNGDPTDNRLVNLRWGSRRENNLDMRQHGTNRNAEKTHCPAGHAYVEHAIVYKHKGRNGDLNAHRVCRPCLAARNLKRRRSKAAIQARIDDRQRGVA
jgi:hypothetical protein